MGELFEMPASLPEEEKQPEAKQNIYLEFDDMEKRAEGMKAINMLRNENPDLFEGLASVKIDNERKTEGLELAFETEMNGRSQKILDLLHKKGVMLNTAKGAEELPYEQHAA